MTEPLLFGTTLVAVALVADWVERGAPDWPLAAGLAVAAACMTRHEAWPVCAALLSLAFAVLLRRGTSPRGDDGDRPAGGIPNGRDCALPAQQPMDGRRLVCQRRVLCCGERCDRPATAGVGSGKRRCLSTLRVRLWSGRRRRRSADRVGLCAIALARVDGARSGAGGRSGPALVRILRGPPVPHPLWGAARRRVRGARRRRHWLASARSASRCRNRRRGSVYLAGLTTRSAPVIVESQRDAQNMEGRRAVTAYLRTHYDGRPIMMSMGSLAHYMHDLSLEGFDIHDFLQEGNGEVWVSAMQRGPAA